MNAYIVMQGKTYSQEKESGTLFSRRRDLGGHLQHSWERMREVRKDDLIFHYVNGSILAVSLATSNGTETPTDFQKENDGYMVKLDFHELEVPITIAHHLDVITPLLPVKYSAFQANGQGNQGYLYPCNDELAIQLMELISEANLILPDEEQLSLAMDAVEVQNQNPLILLITRAESGLRTKIRLGKSKFRQKIESIWNRSCPLCGINLTDALGASYAKPWKDSSDDERLDPYNGILLCCNHHALYEKGYISFDGKGYIHISKEIDENSYDKFLLDPEIKIQTFPEHKPYFRWHKKYIFKG